MDTKPKVSLDIFNDIRSLPQEEQYAIARKLMGMLSSPRGGSSYLGDVDVSGFDDDTLVCPHCGGIHVIKKGYANDHITRRYKCMDCGKGFRKTTNSVISFTHKSTDVWERFILMTLRKETLEACTKECGISIATAFSWRHKIMAALADDQSERKLTGIIEMDETFTRISYKGNHKKSKDFKMPRPAYHRGSDNRGKMSDRACVLCAIERGKQVYSAVVCRGSLKAELLEKVLSFVSTISNHAITTKRLLLKTEVQAFRARINLFFSLKKTVTFYCPCDMSIWRHKSLTGDIATRKP